MCSAAGATTTTLTLAQSFPFPPLSLSHSLLNLIQKKKGFIGRTNNTLFFKMSPCLLFILSVSPSPSLRYSLRLLQEESQQNKAMAISVGGNTLREVHCDALKAH